MTEVVGVRFKSLGKIYYFDPDGLSIPAGTDVVVETARGLEYGKAVLGNREVEDKSVVQPLRKVTRQATEDDREKMLSGVRSKLRLNSSATRLTNTKSITANNIIAVEKVP